MARGVGKIALGQGLMAFGQAFQQNMDAQERRRQSLEELAMRYQQSMELADYQNDLATQRLMTAEDIRREGREYDIANPTDLDLARIDATNAQAEAARALAAQRSRPGGGRDLSDIFAKVPPELVTPEFMEKLEQGIYDPTLLRQRGSERPFGGEGLDRFALEEAYRMIPATDEFGNAVNGVEFLIENDPALAQEAGINREMNLIEARRRLARYQLETLRAEDESPSNGFDEKMNIYGQPSGLMGGGIFGPNQMDQWRSN